MSIKTALYVSLSLVVGCTSAFAQAPSFDCAKAMYPDERAICSNAELSQLDNVANAGFEYVRRVYGIQYAKSVTLPPLQARRACGSDVACIRQQQLAAIQKFKSLGAPANVPQDAPIHLNDATAAFLSQLGAGVPTSPALPDGNGLMPLPRQQTTAAPMSSAASGETLVGQWSGAGDGKTKVFHIERAPWELRWRVSNGMNIQVYKDQKDGTARLVANVTRACLQLSRIIAAANCTPARKFLASLS
jgi:hypothetical protein